MNFDIFTSSKCEKKNEKSRNDLMMTWQFAEESSLKPCLEPHRTPVE